MQREPAANAGRDTARMKEDRVGSPNRRRHLRDRAVADGDQNELGISRQLGNRALLSLEQRGNGTVGPQGDPADGPADATPRRPERPGGPSASDDAEFHTMS